MSSIYVAPLPDILFVLHHVAGLDRFIADGLAPNLDFDLAGTLLTEMARFAEEELAPLNHDADKVGAHFKQGRVTTPCGFPAVYKAWAAAGWNSVCGPVEHGGADLPLMVNTAAMEMTTSASMGFSVGPVLTQAAVDTLMAHGSDALKAIYLPKLVSGEWAATMNLTEPQAGSDLGRVRTRAVAGTDGSHRIIGSKIFITHGEHDWTDNIIHLVLARLQGAPDGTKGLSLFLVPKYLPDADGRPGVANDLRCTGIEAKLGLHASPTCSMSYGDHGGATGWLIGEPNKGLACMFTMMNRARVATALQGVAIAERAFQQARAFAGERRQGRAPGEGGADASPIIGHPDVQTMLMTMRGLTFATRAVAYATAEAVDRAECGADPAARDRADLLTPIAKGFCSDIGFEVASLGVQIHGGMGFVEETGAAQHLRDVRIASIYEGTNGIQAIDLVTRKLPRAGGDAVRSLIAGFHTTATACQANPTLQAIGQRLDAALQDLETTTDWLLAPARTQAGSLSGATSYLRLFGITAGVCLLAQGLIAARDGKSDAVPDPLSDKITVIVGFLASQRLPETAGLTAATLSAAAGLDQALFAIAAD